MATYLFEVSYTSACSGGTGQKSAGSGRVVWKAVKKLGGKVHGFSFAFGESDVIGVLEMPDNASMAAFALAIGAGGACSKVKTTALPTTSEAKEAMDAPGYKFVQSL
jgi:uncharacterized protein with GYD domain